MVLVEPTRFHSNRKRRERVIAEREREVNEATNAGGKNNRVNKRHVKEGQPIERRATMVARIG